MEANRPELSVIVPTHNRRELLRSCLASLERQTARPDAFEVVVVVDGSTDGTSEMLAELSPPFQISVISQPQAGQSAAINAGADRAAGRILLFMDDDEEASATHVSAHLEAHGTRDRIAAIGVIRGRLPAHPDRFVSLRAEAARRHWDDLPRRQPTYDDCYGGNFSVSHSIFDELGGFAEDLPRETDFDFAYRMHTAGVEFVLAPGSEVTQAITKNWREILAEGELRGRVAVTLYDRHPALISTMPFGGEGYRSGTWHMARSLALAVNASPVVLARIGFLLPRRSWAHAWFQFLWSYCYWRGVRAAADPELWRRSRRGVLILMYHAFGDDRERPSRYVVPARRFARQMAWLKRRRYNVISLSDYVEHRREHRLPPPKSVVITIDDGFVDTDTLARPVLERFGFPATVFLISSRDGRDPADTDPALAGRALLAPARARNLLGGPIEIGAHTRTHPDLAMLSPADAEAEVVGSKRDLERALGVPVTAFSYPYGELNPSVRGIVRAADFWSACGIAPGHNRPATDSFNLRRVNISGTYTLLRFVATLVIGDTRGLLRRRKQR